MLLIQSQERTDKMRLIYADYLKCNVLIKVGIIICIMGIWIALGNYLGWIVVYDYLFYKQAFIFGAVVGILLIVIGMIKNKCK